MNEESTQRISKTTAACMITVAVLFDLAQLACKLLTLAGFTLAGGIVGALTCYYMNIDFPKSCAVAGGALAFAASFTGIGTVIALKVGILMDWLASTLFSVVGYAIMYFWFGTKGVSLFSGNSATKKVSTTIVSFLVDAIPLLSALPGITTWTITMIVITRSEDKQKEKEARAGYNEQDASRMRKPLRRYVRTANTF